MKHSVLCDLYPEPGGFMTAQPVCSCGWRGKHYDVGEIEGRKAYDVEVLTHRLGVSVARGCAVGLVLAAVLWVGVMIAGVIIGIRWMAGAWM